MKFIKSTLTIFLLSTSLIGAITQKEQAFIEKYKVDADIQEILDAHVEDLKARMEDSDYYGEGTHFVWTFDWFPGYFVKASLERIYGMEKMQRCIEQNKLDLITVPDKRIYHIKGRPQTLNNSNYVVVVKKVPQEESGPLNLEQVKQLCTIIEKTHYISMTATNYIRQKDNKICIIDTESTFDESLLLKGYMRLLTSFHDINRDYTIDAQRYICDKLIAAIKSGVRGGYDWKKIAPLLAKKYRKSKQQWDYSTYFTTQLSKKNNTSGKP